MQMPATVAGEGDGVRDGEAVPDPRPDAMYAAINMAKVPKTSRSNCPGRRWIKTPPAAAPVASPPAMARNRGHSIALTR